MPVPLARGDCWHLNHTNTLEYDDKRYRRLLVGVIDYGIEISHQEFSDPVRTSLQFAEIRGSQVNPKATPTDYSNDDAVFGDQAGHGTAVAALVTGCTVGVIPNCNLAVCGIRPDRGRFINQAQIPIAEALLWLADLTPSPDIIVCSLGISELGQNLRTLREAIKYTVDEKLIPLVAANGDKLQTKSTQYPAAYDRVISVSATMKKDNDKWAYNVYTTDWQNPTISAPGVAVYSAGTGHNEAHRLWEGTSFSAPIAAGTLLRNMRTPAAIQKILGNYNMPPGSLIVHQPRDVMRGAGLIRYIG